jgi:hypothetical protein
MEGGRKRLWQKGGHLSSLTDLTRRWLPENHQTSRITCRETIVKERFWRMRPDGIAVLPPAGNKDDVFCILEHKRMSDVCYRYLLRVKLTVENQYTSLRSTISEVIHRHGWKVKQISFVTSWRSVNKQELRKNLKFVQVPEASIQSVYSKLTMRVFDVYANILKCMYSTRFSGGSTRLGASSEAQSTTIVVTPLIHTLDTSRPDKYKRWRKESHETNDN